MAPSISCAMAPTPRRVGIPRPRIELFPTVRRRLLHSSPLGFPAQQVNAENLETDDVDSMSSVEDMEFLDTPCYYMESEEENYSDELEEEEEDDEDEFEEDEDDEEMWTSSDHYSDTSEGYSDEEEFSHSYTPCSAKDPLAFQSPTPVRVDTVFAKINSSCEHDLKMDDSKKEVSSPSSKKDPPKVLSQEFRQSYQWHLTGSDCKLVHPPLLDFWLQVVINRRQFCFCTQVEFDNFYCANLLQRASTRTPSKVSSMNDRHSKLAFSAGTKDSEVVLKNLEPQRIFPSYLSIV